MLYFKRYIITQYPKEKEGNKYIRISEGYWMEESCIKIIMKDKHFNQMKYYFLVYGSVELRQLRMPMYR